MTELAYPSGLASGPGQVRLQEFVGCLQPAEVLRFRDAPVDGLAFHSAEVRPGNLFFAIRGTRHNGATYAAQAVARGAVAVVADEPLAVQAPVLVVGNTRIALAEAARFYYRDPSQAVPVIGVTGTNGKTSVAHLIRACLRADRRQVGLLGTIAYEFGGRRIPATTTTPDPIRIHGYLREMADRFAGACIMEVSSHALVQERVHGVRFHTGVFLNLTQDHLDYHGTMAEYAAAKARLFQSLPQGSFACLAADDPASTLMEDVLDGGAHVLRFGTSERADVRAENIACSVDGTRFDMVMPHGRVEMFLRLPGMHNVQNALAAAAASLTLGVSELTIASALEDARPVPGRLEAVEPPLGTGAGAPKVFVDYAHTPDALEQVCSCLRALTPGRLLVVFGCGGDRDRSKRAPMGRAVAAHADLGFLTSDNPRSEDPEAILDDIEPGLQGARGLFYRIVDRGEAIRRAISEARAGDTVLIAGKGHETYQILRESVVPFDDRLVAARAMAAVEAGWLPR